MSRVRLWIVPAAVVIGVLVALPLVKLTDTRVERSLRSRLGIGDAGCQPHTVASPGWSPAPSLGHPRDEPRAVAIAGRIYLAGGITALLSYDEPGSNPQGVDRVEVRSLRNLTRFDPRTGTYAEMAPMPQALNHIGAVAYDGELYVVGGHGTLLNGLDARADLFRYSPAQNRWTRLAPMPTARGAVAVGVIGHKLYVAGGMLEGRPLTTVEAYDFKTGRWSRAADLPAPREHIAGAVLRGRFYVIGGRNRYTDALRDVTRYDPARDRWERVADLPVRSGGLEALTFGDSVIAMGGGNDRGRTVTGAVERFDPDSGRWTALPEMRTRRHGFAGVVVGQRIWTFGGSACALFNATDIVETFTPERVSR